MSENEGGFIFDPLFRNSKGKVVDAPHLAGIAADTHCHLDMLEHPELALARCAYNNVMFVATVVEASEGPQRTYDMLAEWLGSASALLDRWEATSLLPICRIIAGTHPHSASKFDKETRSVLLTCATHPLTAAIGEIGLDYHYDLSPRDVQRDVFRRQIEIAKKVSKPVVLHIREAHEDALEILDSEGIPDEGVLVHCFTSDHETLQCYIDRGCHVAFGGALTFTGSDDIREAASLAPLDRILTETDSPYMSPVPLRGTVCSPENVIFTIERLLEARGVETEEEQADFLDILFRNALRFFNVAPA